MFSAVKIITKAVSDIKHVRVRQTKVASLFDHPGATQAISGLLSGLLELSKKKKKKKCGLIESVAPGAPTLLPSGC
jgi:hypothetical protein